MINLIAANSGNAASAISGGRIESLDAFTGGTWGNCVKDGVATLQCIPAVFQLILTFAFSLAGIAAVFFVLLSGFKFITSGGDAKQVEGARKTLTFAIIGLIIVLLSFAIIKLIGAVFMPGNPNCLTTFGFLDNSPCK